MILRRYLLRQILAAFSMVVATMLLVFVANRFATLLAEAAAGRTARGYMLELLALKSVDALTMLAPASLYAGLLLALGRLDRDRELLAMAAGGLGRTRLAGIVAAIGLGFAAAIGVHSMLASPIVSERYEVLKAEARGAASLSRIVAGRFIRSGEGEPVLFVRRVEPDGRSMEGVFLHRAAGASDEIVTAARAHHGFDGGGKLVVLEDGWRYFGTPGDGAWSSTRFARYAVRVGDAPRKTAASRWESFPSIELWRASGREPGAAAELQWRISQPLLTLVLAGLAFAFAVPGVARGRYENLFRGVIAYLAYMGLVATATSAVESGDLPPAIGVWPVHAAFAALAARLIGGGAGRLGTR